jgi:hypothetical protein
MIMKFTKTISASIITLLVALSIPVLGPSNASALVGAALPTHCGAKLGYNKVLATDYDGTVLAILDSAAPYYTTRVSGTTGECVKDIQRMMNAAYCTTGTKLTVDGIYGPRTYTAIYNMQRYASGYYLTIGGKRVLVDGKVGPQTWSLLTAKSVDMRFNPCR